MTTTEYAPGRSVDLYGRLDHGPDPTVLLWHGMQTDSRGALAPLATAITGHGLAVAVPDWNSHAPDGGRADLLASVDFARARIGDAGGLVVVGWSMGGVAAAGLTLEAGKLGVPVVHTVCLAGAFAATDPISGRVLTDDLADRPHERGIPFTLLHGTHDDVVRPSASITFADDLERAGWPVEVVELDADHGSIAGARYDPDTDGYAPAEDPPTLAIARDVAGRIAAVVGR